MPDSIKRVVDKVLLVKQVCFTMKTATVRDLRQRFGDVVKWIEAGEEIAVTRRGVVVATLSPPKPIPRPRKPDWERRLRERPPVGRQLTAAETEEFHQASKRDC